MEFQPRAIAERIYEYRTNAKMTQQELANETGLARGYISSLENMSNTPSLDALLKIARATNAASIDVFLYENLTYYQTKHSKNVIQTAEQQLTENTTEELQILLDFANYLKQAEEGQKG